MQSRSSRNNPNPPLRWSLLLPVVHVDVTKNALETIFNLDWSVTPIKLSYARNMFYRIWRILEFAHTPG